MERVWVVLMDTKVQFVMNVGFAFAFVRHFFKNDQSIIIKNSSRDDAYSGYELYCYQVERLWKIWSKICLSNELILTSHLLFYFVTDLGSKNKRKPKLNFSNFVFHENTHGCTIIVKVKVLFTTQYKFAYILLIMSKLFLKIIEWHAMKKKIIKCLNIIKDCIHVYLTFPY